MLFGSITHPDIARVAMSELDGIELRLDLFERLEIGEVKKIIDTVKKPVLLTLRKKTQGGGFRGSEEEREKEILKLLALESAYFDLEADMRDEFILAAMQKHPKTRFVLSHHDFEKMPKDLDGIYRSMARYSPFTCKIAVTPKSANEAMEMLLFVKRHPKMSGICMGEKGEFTRVLGKVMGNVVDYTNVDGVATGPGQIPVEDLLGLYHYRALNQSTAIYGLIGSPITQSPGHRHHNEVFRKKGVNAVYVKMHVASEEVGAFLTLARELGIKGLSVTIPLKEKVLPFVDEIDRTAKAIGAVNTLVFRGGKIYGSNTDGFGALDPIEKRGIVKGKTVVLLGAGGAARAIAYEAHARGAKVVILNRTVERAVALAKQFGGIGGGLDAVPEHYDVLINCAPEPMPIDPEKILKSAVVMDIALYPKETAFLQAAKKRGCTVIYGEEMYLRQAEGQTEIWMRNLSNYTKKVEESEN